MKKQLILVSLLFFAINMTGFGQGKKGQSFGKRSAEGIMQYVGEQAQKENKKVLVIFHASWCGWCKKMEASINDPAIKKMFDDNYVIAYIDAMEQPDKKDLETPNSLALITKYKGEKSGLPFWFIADDKGNKLADSHIRPSGAALDTYGENIGCPAEESEVAHFLEILKATSSLNAEQLAIIGKRFALNKPTPVPAKGSN
ncbi:hypothetical protein GCM10023149_45320 [Mucilaginibacter gynuensis]|uniref:Thioredoxin domain-containing protein n=1 Tax=Mucilaginibacter gynuensis TaxID=1302236 RepID=A0ABP8HA34_9SPHI